MANPIEWNLFALAEHCATLSPRIIERKGYETVDHKKIETGVRLMLEGIGEDPDRPGLRDTPKRISAMCEELFQGVSQNAAEEIQVFFTESYDELVLVRDIGFASMCEHHLLPFFGVAHVAYIPRDGRITGLSKLARVVDRVARRPQIQERLTTSIADIIEKQLEPVGVATVVEAEHMCMTLRGVHKPGSKTVTSAMRGVFKENLSSRSEVMSLIANGRG